MSRREVVAIIGAGAVGTGMALMARAGGHRVAAVISRTPRSARSLARTVGAGVWGTRMEQIPEDVSLFLIAVPDPQIESVSRRLAQSLPDSRRRRRACHTSGPVTSDALRPLAKKGVSVCSIHPIHSFPSVPGRTKDTRSLTAEWFGIEGTRESQRWARSFVRTLHGRVIVVPKSKKTQYHIACTFASNYPLVVLRGAEQVARSAGLKGGLRPLQVLLFDSLRNGFELGPMRALTGPIVRGDGMTLRRHRSEIRKTIPHLVPLFDHLVAFAAREAVAAGRITQAQRRALRMAAKRLK